MGTDDRTQRLPAAGDHLRVVDSREATADQWAEVVHGGEPAAPPSQWLCESTPAILHSINSDGRLIHVSDPWLAKTGYARHEVIGRALTDFLPPTAREHFTRTDILELFRVDRLADVERQLVCKDGTTTDVVVSAIRVRDEQGCLMSVSVLQDVTERNRAQAALVAEHERLRVTLDSIGEGVIALDRERNVEYLNPVAQRLTGWSNEEAKGLPADEVFRLVDDATRLSTTSTLTASTRPAIEVGDTATLLARDGQEYCIECCVAPIKDTSGVAMGAVLVFRDVSERVRLHREVLHRATHDALTGILNRDEFERRLHAAVHNAGVSGGRYALLYIDLDRFKLVNDAGGHAAGDRLLRQTVGLIGRFVLEGETFARLGGDEFGLLLEQRRAKDAQRIAEQICQELDAFRFCEGGRHLHIGASIGLILFDHCWNTAASVLQAADSACYAAKAAGRNRAHIYTASDEVIESHRGDMQWARRLEEALDKGQFALHWQRIVALEDDGTALHGEVLLRMVDDDGKLISPGLFLPSAERFQMATRLDRWVVREVFELMAQHKHHSACLATVSVNLSGQSLSDRDFHRYVCDLLDCLDFDPHKLCFEITETAVITNLTEAHGFFASMRARGVRFALDDFGSGLSSFGYLKALPVDYLKIDGQFIKGLADDPVDQATVRCIGEIARATGKRTIAEFVETEAVETILQDIGIDFAQGYLRHRPAPIANLFEAAREFAAGEL
ncbi:MAG TPA: EAL domain-containing protein [Trinickia sp.]|jgi:diguanylate cyclase (GGDEF)-like protein/PAS domain S-box-containing protein|uniref:EAL domain-containing protein n=1 Tax=Trinickia sp. TaxID=2571163 RepID=UPI002BC57EBD|nr:EAL domain-containing protein [Trinickia sp.]HTI17040.1 EAL domain-containing protein [Trinickia sp.]